jgi:hypothetical protein
VSFVGSGRSGTSTPLPSGVNYGPSRATDVGDFQSTYTPVWGDAGRSRTVNPGNRPSDTYGQTVYDDGPIAYFRLNGDTSDIAGGSPGSLSGTSGFTGAALLPAFPSAVSLDVDGLSGQMSIPEQTKLDITAGISVECWFVADTYNSSAYSAAFSKSQLWTIELFQGQPEFFVNASGGLTQARSSTAVTTGQVYHAVGTFDGSNIRLYLNGVLAAGPVPLSGTIVTNGLLAYVGSWDGAGTWFDGRIAEAAIYNYVLTPTQVGNHYAVGNPSTPATVAGPVATVAAAAPAGTVSAGVTVAGPVAAVAAAAPAGAVGVGAGIAGPVAAAAVAAPAGSLSVGIAVPGPVAAVTVAALAGTLAVGSTIAGRHRGSVSILHAGPGRRDPRRASRPGVVLARVQTGLVATPKRRPSSCSASPRTGRPTVVRESRTPDRTRP